MNKLLQKKILARSTFAQQTFHFIPNFFSAFAVGSLAQMSGA